MSTNTLATNESVAKSPPLRTKACISLLRANISKCEHVGTAPVNVTLIMFHVTTSSPSPGENASVVVVQKSLCSLLTRLMREYMESNMLMGKHLRGSRA